MTACSPTLRRMSSNRLMRVLLASWMALFATGSSAWLLAQEPGTPKPDKSAGGEAKAEPKAKVENPFRTGSRHRSWKVASSG
jgi:hypothetical protein